MCSSSAAISGVRHVRSAPISTAVRRCFEDGKTLQARWNGSNNISTVIYLHRISDTARAGDLVDPVAAFFLAAALRRRPFGEPTPEFSG